MDSAVQVAVRIRPQMPSEILDMCQVCTNVTPGEPQVWLGNDKTFTFDKVFNMNTSQEEVYTSCTDELIKGCLKGYNATILAYGQTGSGKTYTMGTSFDVSMRDEEKGIIPRAVHKLFEGMSTMRKEALARSVTPPDFKIVAQFMELYNEDIIDLLDDSVRDESKKHIKIHENADGQIYTVGLSSSPVTTASEALERLKEGALSRTTASTKMNVQSSRSHAIFTLHIKMQRVLEPEEGSEKVEGSEEFETLMSKLNFVDLAGSERLKRTGATGERAREGISINCGLLALGNVISALGDKNKKATHVPYRDSKLTRLLQDSLGGNSQTLMIACISPSDRDFMETLNTLNYANRAKNIQNKVRINQDKSGQTIAHLRREIQALQLELIEYKQGKRMVGENGEEQVNDMYHENQFLQSELNNLRSRLKALQETLDHQTRRVTELLAEKAAGLWIMAGQDSNDFNDMSEVIKGYLKEIEELRVKLMESEETCCQLRRQAQKNQRQSKMSFVPDLFDMSMSPPSTYQLISEAKEDIKKLTKQAKQLEVMNSDGNDAKDNADDEKEKEDSPEDSSTKMNGELELNGDLEEEEEDLEVDESSDDSDSEEKATDAYFADVAQLTQDISLKQKLIEALEQNQQRMQAMKRHYEGKLMQLEKKYHETEMERDRVIEDLSKNKGKKTDKQIKQVKADYESKLSGLQSELRKMRIMEKEHNRVLKNQAQCERQIQQMKNEVAEMKRNKVQLINKLKEESQRHRQLELQRNRELAKLKKQDRLKENHIRNLEAEKRLKEGVLKRRQEELAALKRSAKLFMSDKVAGRVGPQRNLNSTFLIHQRNIFSPKIVKSRWQNLEKSINKLVINKQSISCIERDMERYMKGRERLTRKLETLQKKRNTAVEQKSNVDFIRDYDENIETLKANIDYYLQKISECQSSIVQLEETKEDLDQLDVGKMDISTHELKYLLNKMISMTINQTFEAYQKDVALKELQEKNKHLEDENALKLEFLERVVERGNPDEVEFVMSEDDFVPDSQCSSRSASPVDSVSEGSTPYLSHVPQDTSKSKKSRPPRKTNLPTDFLEIERSVSQLTPAGSCPTVNESTETTKPATSRLAWSFGPALQQELDLDRTLTSSPNNQQSDSGGIVRVTSAPTSLQDMTLSKRVAEKSPLAGRRRGTYEKQQQHMADFSPAFRRKFYPNASVIPVPSLSRQSSTETTVSDATPPTSPSGSRKSREDNVFSRLTSGSFRLNKPGSGVILPFSSSKTAFNVLRNSPFVCTHTAKGHSRAVLSLAATNDVLFSSSRDRTVKIWDLSTGKEIQSLGGHPDNVCTIRYNEYSRLAFSVCTAYIRVWDVRENPAMCLRTLSSSGECNSVQTSAQNQPKLLQIPVGENQIYDIALNCYGTTLFSAAGNIVRIWDLRTFKAVGKLSGRVRSSITCLAVESDAAEKNTVVTGSRDHYIKVYEVCENSRSLHTAQTKLEPPHYDGIQSLALNGTTLFSGSRDMCIKKWDLATGNHIQSLNGAHKDWVNSLSFFSNESLLLSGCRGGFLKLWDVASTQLMGELKAHSASINSIATNSSCIFSACSDGTIGIWRLRNNSDLSPDNSEYVDP